MNIIEKIILIIAIIAIPYFSFGTFMAFKLIKPKKKSYIQCVERQLGKKKIDEDDLTLPFAEYSLKSKYGYDMYARMYKADKPTDKLIVWLHGYKASAVSGIKLAKLYNSFGYDVFIPEHRHCGKSGGKTVTFGLKEKEDVKQWINEVKILFPNAKLYMVGESLGAATAIWVASEMPDEFGFLIADSSYYSLMYILGSHIGIDYPKFSILLLPSFRIMSTLLFGIRPSRIKIGEKLKQIKIPTLLTHAVNDEVTPFVNAEKLRDAKPDAVFVAFDNCMHTMAVINYNDRYRKMIEDFLKGIGEIE